MYVVGLHKSNGIKRLGKRLMPGDPIPDVDEIKPNVLQSLINQKWIMRKEEYEYLKAKREEKLANRKKEKDAIKKEREKHAKVMADADRERIKQQKVKGDGKKPKDDVVDADVVDSDAVDTDEPVVVDTDLDLPDHEISEDDQYKAMSKKELQALCKEKGLSVAGNKQTLTERLMEAG